MAVLLVEDLHKSYGPVQAVRGVSFTVAAGEVFGLLGPNGAGKTTTVETVIGLLRRDRGKVVLFGLDPEKDPLSIKSRIGVQLQTVHLFPRLTVLETLRLFGSFYPKSRSPEELLALLGLTDKARSPVEKLSGGQLRRLSVALALVGDGEALFLDEPTSGLDPQSRRGLWEVIERLRGEGKTVFLTTHYLDEAERLCDRVAIMDEGRIIALGKPKDLIAEHFREKALEIPLAGLDDVAFFGDLPGVVRVQRDEDVVTLYTQDLAQTFLALSRLSEVRGVSLRNMVVREATLEDVFLHLTGRRIRD
uniref:ABC transporter ATP-binding protein n=1 Tax=Candidatus Caldatribacterium californiense TaxID=1454726 RepID=A0A7V3YF00_9BACT